MNRTILNEQGECYCLLKGCDHLEAFLPSLIIEKNYHNSIYLPVKNYNGDAGFDVFLPLDINSYIEPMKSAFIDLGFKAYFSDGWKLEMRDKSGLAKNHLLHVIGGEIDSNYRGNLHLNIMNLSDIQYHLQGGEKIAQMILVRCDTIKQEPYKLSKPFFVTNCITERGDGGHGSTGK
jgi:dUTP pyrophosphatase